MSDEPLIAVFIDYENLALGVPDGAQGRVRIDVVIKRLLERGRIVFQRAYCDWSHYRSAGQDLHRLGVTMVDIPRTRMSGKNSADIHMVVDAMDLCFSKEHIGTFALITGDSDFSPLVQKLKECDKRVLGCGARDSTSALLVASCDEFMYYEDLVARAARPAAKPVAAGKDRRPSRDDACDIVEDVLRNLADDHDTVWASMVKQAVGRLHPGFDHRTYGFETFASVLHALEDREIVDLELDRSRGNYRISLVED